MIGGKRLKEKHVILNAPSEKGKNTVNPTTTMLSMTYKLT